MTNDQRNASDNGAKHSVWRFRGYGFCTKPAPQMCAQCSVMIRDQGMERAVAREMGVYQQSTDAPKSIVGSVVPDDFMYV